MSLVIALGALAAIAGLRLQGGGLAGEAGPGAGAGGVARGAAGYLRRQWGVSAAWALGVSAVLATVHGALRPHQEVDPFSSRAVVALVQVAGFALGTIAPTLAAHLAIATDLHAFDASADHPAGSVKRGAGIALVGLGVAALAFAGALGLAWALAPDGAARATMLPLAVGAHGLGTVVAAAVVHLGGGLFVAGALPAARAALADEPDARNPAAAVERVGRRVGLGVVAATGVELAALDVVAATVLAAGLCAANAPWLARVGLGAIAVVLAPLVLRGFALVATWVGAMAVKRGDDEPAQRALERGHLVACALTALGTLAATHWLLRGAFVGFGGAGVLGVVAGWALARFGVAPGEGAIAATVPTLAVVVLGAAGWALGAATGLSHGGVFGVALTTVGVIGSSPFVLATALVEPAEAPTRPAATAWRRLALVAGVLVAWCLLRAFFYATLVHRAATTLVHAIPEVDLGRPAMLVSCALGAVLAIAAAMLTVRAAPHVGGELEAEVARALADVERGADGVRVFSLDFHAPADRAVGNVAADAHLHAAATLLALLGVPIVVGVTMRRVADLGAESVAALGLGAMMVALVLPPLGRALGGLEGEGASRPAAAWLGLGARVVTALALALPSVFA